MANAIEIKFTGDLERALDQFEAQAKAKVLFSGAYGMARVMYDEVKLNVEPPRLGIKTGNLQRAIYHVYSPEQSDEDKKTYKISWNKRTAPHGHLIEFGTARAPAYPFIRPAFDHIGRAIAVGKARMAQRMAGGVA